MQRHCLVLSWNKRLNKHHPEQKYPPANGLFCQQAGGYYVSAAIQTVYVNVYISFLPEYRRHVQV